MGYSMVNLPPQQLPFNKKTKQWRKQHLDWADSKTFFNYSLVRKSVIHKKINYDLLNGKLHMKDLEMILNPQNIQAGFIPDRIQHYPIMNSKLNVLRGEESKRAFDFKVVVTNPNSISEIENNKKQEILQRLLPIQIGFCGTIHAYANYLLISNGIDTKDSISEEEFDKLFEQIKENPQCCENLKISHLLLDEAQDSNQNQFDFIFDLLKPDNWTIFGDEKQSIFGFNGANPKALTNISKELYVTNYQMTENFRNSKEIHSFASYIISKAGKEYINNSKLIRLFVKHPKV